VFSEALQGVDARNGSHVLVADKSEEGLLSALHLLADDAELADAIGLRGRQLATENHDWREIAGRLEARLLRLLDEKPSPAPPISATLR
jgi:glycosyltransferase involved in cell wall biosynthesis